MLRLILIPLLCCWLTPGVAQLNDEQNKQIDSLKEVIESAEHDSTVVNAYVSWDDIIYLSDPALNQELNTKIIAICQKNIADELSAKSNVFFHARISEAFSNIGIVYANQGNYEQALSYYEKSLNINEELGDKSGIATTNNNIGSIYADQGNYELALFYNEKCLNIDKELGDKDGMATSYNNIGLIYKEQGNYEQALSYYEKSLNINEELGDKHGMATSYNNIGNIYAEQGNYEQALEYHDRSLKINEEIGDKIGMATSYNNIGDIYADQGNYSKTLGFGKKALTLAQEVGAVLKIRSASKLLYNVYKKIGQPAKALEMHELTIKMNDSINSKENKEAVIKLEFQHKYEKEQVIADTKHQEQMALSAEREKRQQLIAISAGGGFVMVLIFSFFIACFLEYL